MSVVQKFSIIDQHATESDEIKKLQADYTSSWVWRALPAIVELLPQAEAIELADRLGVAIPEVVEGLEGLCKLGIIRRGEQGYQRILKYVYFTDRQFEAKKLVSDHVLISTQLLSRIKPAQANSFYRSSFLATSEARLTAFLKDMEGLMKELIIKSSQEKSDAVWGLSLSAAELAKTKGE